MRLFEIYLEVFLEFFSLIKNLTEDSTEEIARKIKEYMSINKISQRTFAQSLLNMKQANFSALLSQPMTWYTITKTIKDRYLTMHLWLNDPDRMEKLNNHSRHFRLPACE